MHLALSSSGRHASLQGRPNRGRSAIPADAQCAVRRNVIAPTEICYIDGCETTLVESGEGANGVPEAGNSAVGNDKGIVWSYRHVLSLEEAHASPSTRPAEMLLRASRFRVCGGVCHR